MRWILFGLAVVAVIAALGTYASAAGPNFRVEAIIEFLVAAVFFAAGAIVDAQVRAQEALEQALAKLVNKPVIVTSAPDSGTHGGYQDGVE